MRGFCFCRPARRADRNIAGNYPRADERARRFMDHRTVFARARRISAGRSTTRNFFFSLPPGKFPDRRSLGDDTENRKKKNKQKRLNGNRGQSSGLLAAAIKGRRKRARPRHASARFSAVRAGCAPRLDPHSRTPSVFRCRGTTDPDSLQPLAGSEISISSPPQDDE